MSNPNARQPELSLTGMAALLDQGVREFNIGRFWHAHEDWEKAWLRLNGADKIALQGMIQAAASFYLLEKGRMRPATALAGSALGKFAAAASTAASGSAAPARENRVEIPGLEELLREISAEAPAGTGSAAGIPAATPASGTPADRAPEWIRRARALRAFRHRGVAVTGNSKRVDSTQIGPHPDLEARVQRVLGFKHELRISDEDRARFAALDALVREAGLPVILDSGCGTGTSSELLVQRHPQSLVIGVDRSPHRLGKAVSRIGGSRKGGGPAEASNAVEIAPGIQRFGDRLVIARFEMSRFWTLASQAGWTIARHYVLYPNPWPKPNALRRRWHGHEVFPTLARLAPELEVRSNWLIYLEEFHEAFRIVARKEGVLETLGAAELREPLTPFERKYRDSGHDLWRWRVTL